MLIFTQDSEAFGVCSACSVLQYDHTKSGEAKKSELSYTFSTEVRVLLQTATL